MNSLSKAYALLALALVLPVLAIATPYLGSLIRPDMLMAYYAIAGLGLMGAHDHHSTRRAPRSASRAHIAS